MSTETPASASEFDAAVTSALKAVWWLVLLRGVLAVVFGVLAIMAPVLALLAIVFVFAAYAILDGVVGIAHAIRVRDRHKGWGWLVAQGVISVLAGVAAAIFPGLAGTVGALFVLWTIVIYALIAGITGIPAAAALADGGRKVVAFILAIGSIVFAVLLAVLLVVNPIVESVLALIWVVGIYSIVTGVMLVVLAIQARIVGKKVLAGAST